MFKSTLLGGMSLLFLCSSFLISTQPSEKGEIDLQFEEIRCNDEFLTSLRLEKINELLEDELQLQFIVSSANQIQKTKVRTISFSDQGVAQGDCEHPELLIDQSALFSNESEPEVLNITVRIL